MDIVRVDHPLQHVLGALSALCGEGRNKGIRHIIRWCYKRQSCINSNNIYRQFCNIIKRIGFSSTVKAVIALMAVGDSNGETWKK